MRQVIAKIDEIMEIGRQGENNVAQVVFPVVTEWTQLYGSGTFQVVVKRPDNDYLYTLTLTKDTTNVYWVITSTETAIVGKGTAELQYVVNDSIAKSQLYTFRVVKSIDTIVDKSLIIQHGDSCYIPVRLTVGNALATPTNIDDIRIKVNDVLKYYSTNVISFDATSGCWLYPITEEESKALPKCVPIQAGIKVGSQVANSKVVYITSEESIIDETWGNPT